MVTKVHRWNVGDVQLSFLTLCLESSCLDLASARVSRSEVKHQPMAVQVCTVSLESSDTWCDVAIQPDRTLAAKFKSRRTTWLRGRAGMSGRKRRGMVEPPLAVVSPVLYLSVHRYFQERLYTYDGMRTGDGTVQYVEGGGRCTGKCGGCRRHQIQSVDTAIGSW